MSQKFTVMDGSDKDETHAVIDINQVREQRALEKKRRAERVFFKNILNVFSEKNDSSMISLEIIDVSEAGCSFQIEPEASGAWPSKSDEIPIKFYFSADFYFEVQVKIVNASISIDGRKKMMRFGCLVNQNHKSYPAYQQFVRFLKVYAEHSSEESTSKKGASI